MTDPRHNGPSPNPDARGGNTAMRRWIIGITAVVLVAFVLAVGWNSNTQTADKTPPAAMGSGGATMPPSTTGSGTTGSAPAMAPSSPTTPDAGAK